MLPKPFTVFQFYIFIAIEVCMVSKVEACSCVPYHPQQIFCNSQFAVRALVTSDRYEVSFGPGNTFSAFNISLLHVFRGIPTLFSIINEKEQHGEIRDDLKYTSFALLTKPPSHKCTVNLNFSDTYLIFGNIKRSYMETGICNFVSEWSEVSRQIKQGVYGDYDCRCRVLTRTDGEENEFVDSNKAVCYLNINLYEPYDECAMNCLTCRKLANPMVVDDVSEECVWIQNEEFQQCNRSLHESD